MRIYGTSDKSNIPGFKLLDFILESNKFRWANESEISGIKEKYDIFFSYVLFK